MREQVTPLELGTQDGVCLTLTAAGPEQHLSAWDIAAGSLLIREAGGVVTDFSGRDIGIEHTGVVAGNRALHGWLLDTLAGV